MKRSALDRAIYDTGKSKLEIAKAAGIHQSTLTMICRGWRVPTDVQKASLAKVLKTRVIELFP